MIFHIASYYIGSQVYKNLIAAIDKTGIRQVIYVPVKKGDTGKNKIDLETEGSVIAYRDILNLYTRLNFRHKIKKVLADVEALGHTKNATIIHAHTLYSDGAVAYSLNIKYKTPYIITVRSTDINVFFKYFPHLRNQAKKTLLNAKKIIFLSPVYKDKLLKHPFFADCYSELAEKAVIIPNGIDKYWHNNTYKKKGISSTPKLLYAGELIKRKNVLNLINAVIELNKEGYTCTLHIAGDKGTYEEAVKKAALDYGQWIIYHGKMDIESLKELYRSSDVFVMPSVNETFGLVYVEALSQGLPIIYTKDEGVYGYFGGEAGEALESVDTACIKDKIKLVISGYNDYEFTPSEIIRPFNWDMIAKSYATLYGIKSVN